MPHLEQSLRLGVWDAGWVALSGADPGMQPMGEASSMPLDMTL